MCCANGEYATLSVCGCAAVFDINMESAVCCSRMVSSSELLAVAGQYVVLARAPKLLDFEHFLSIYDDRARRCYPQPKVKTVVRPLLKLMLTIF